MSSSSFAVLGFRESARDRSRSIFDFLVTAFITDYHSEKYAPDSSGWRSYVEISKGTKTPLASFYGRDSKDKGGIAELEKIGLIETRVFPGERGRGGRATRVRISYERDEIKDFVSKKMGRASRKIVS